MKRTLSALSCVVLVWMIAGAKPSADELADLLARGGRHASQLAESLSLVIADEAYRQQVWAAPVENRGAKQLEARTIQSEVLFRWLPSESLWLAIRNPSRVDGRAVTDPPPPKWDTLLAGTDAVKRLRQIQADALRHNIGDIVRTTGDPMLVLRFLLPSNQPRFRLRTEGDEQIRGEKVSRVSFTEQRHPTLVRADDADAVATGAVWLRPDGAIVRTQVRYLSIHQLLATLTVDFQQDARLRDWVPIRMEERYERNDGSAVTCLATYKNFRRFETTGRLVGPK